MPRKNTRVSNKRSTNAIVPRAIRNPREMTFRCQQTAYIGAFDVSADTFFALLSRLNQYPNYTSLTSVYDQYRILSVEISMVPTNTVNTIASYVVATGVNTVTRLPTIVTCIDPDDATTPASENIVLDHESCVMHGTFNHTVRRTYQPMAAMEVYQTGGFGGYSAKASPWIDSASPAVEHYGFKASVAHGANNATGSAYTLIYATAILEFRKVF